MCCNKIEQIIFPSMYVDAQEVPMLVGLSKRDVRAKALHVVVLGYLP